MKDPLTFLLNALGWLFFLAACGLGTYAICLWWGLL